MRLLARLASALVLLAAGCQPSVPQAPTLAPSLSATPPPSLSPSPPPSVSTPPSPSLSPSPSPSARPSPAAAIPPAAGSSRVAVLNAATVAFRAGDFPTAVGLYERVVNTPSAADEGAAATTVDDFAHFRALLALLAQSRETEARAHFDELQRRDPNSAFARVATQLWDQYSMTTLLRGACAQLQPQITSQLGPTLTTLQGLGVTVDAQTLCSVPQG